MISSYSEVRLYDLHTGEDRELVKPGVYSVGEALLTEGGAVLSMSTIEPP